MYAVFSVESESFFPDFFADTGEWFSVEGDLDDFIFFDPYSPIPEASSK